MPRKADDERLPDSGAELLAELRSLRSLLEAHACEGDGGLLGLLRLCPGLSLDQWPALSEEYGLRDWLALPMEDEEFPFLAQLQQSLEDLAYQTDHDPLTGLANRRAFDRTLDQETERARRMGQSLSLAIFDLDDFKSVNDTYGHPVGDEVLVGFARTLLSQIRRYDLAARLGGEEFAVLLPGTGQLKAKAMVERVLETVRGLSFRNPANGSSFSVTGSAGLVCYKGYVEAPLPDLVQAADEALYQAKRDGKDRVVTAPLVEVRRPSRASLVESSEKKFLFTGN